MKKLLATPYILMSGLLLVQNALVATAHPRKSITLDPTLTLFKETAPEGTSLMVKEKKSGKAVAWLIFCPYDKKVRKKVDLGPCKDCIGYVSHLYVAQPYRKKGLANYIFIETHRETKRQGFTSLYWLADPYERLELAGGSYGDYIRSNNEKTYQQQLVDLVNIYIKIGAQPSKNADGSYVYVTSPYSGKPAIPCTLSMDAFTLEYT